METINTESQVNKSEISWELIKEKIKSLKLDGEVIYGVPRGGAIIAGMVNMLNGNKVVNNPNEADIIIDDLIDSGRTKDKYVTSFPDKKFISLFDKSKEFQNTWMVFPYEQEIKKEGEDLIVRLLELYGYDVTSDSLIKTPERVIKMYNELLIKQEPNLTVFESNGYDQMIVDKDIPFYSLCEHHILPFFGTVKIGYIPANKIIGLSKLARIVDYFSKGLNTQEYLTQNIADYIHKQLSPLGIGVQIKARHLCKEMRGVQKQGEMITSTLKGVFFNSEVREEFMRL